MLEVHLIYSHIKVKWHRRLTPAAGMLRVATDSLFAGFVERRSAPPAPVPPN